VNKKISFLIILAIVLFLPITFLSSTKITTKTVSLNIASAQYDANSDTGSDSGSGVTVKTMADAAEQTTLYVASAVVVILWVITGILFLSAQGAPEKLKAARTALISAVAGTVLVIVAASAISIVSSAFNLQN
jgi:hypothetical protein